MNAHFLLDVLSVRLASMLTGRAAFFREEIKSSSMRKLVEGVDLDFPEVAGEGRYKVLARTEVGDLDAAFEVAHWRGPDYPTLLFHHGNNERPFDQGLFSKNSFKRIVLDARVEFGANLIVLQAPFHDSYGDYQRRVSRLADFAAMIATSVRLVEQLQAWSRTIGGSPVLVSGISLGGWVTNLHRAYFNSADAYVPLLAGAALDHVFVSSVYRVLTATEALDNPGALYRVLNFEDDFARVPDDNVFALLARHDAIIVFERQMKCYAERRVVVLEKGHVTGALAARKLRQHLLGVLQEFAEGGRDTARGRASVLRQPDSARVREADAG